MEAGRSFYDFIDSSGNLPDMEDVQFQKELNKLVNVMFDAIPIPPKEVSRNDLEVRDKVLKAIKFTLNDIDYKEEINLHRLIIEGMMAITELDIEKQIIE